MSISQIDIWRIAFISAQIAIAIAAFVSSSEVCEWGGGGGGGGTVRKVVRKLAKDKRFILLCITTSKIVPSSVGVTFILVATLIYCY